jgi:hypothetical protein
MNINGAFPSSYLKAADLQGKRVTASIDKVVMEDIGGEHKPVVKFQGKDRGIVLNKTNAQMIAEIAGTDETDDWKGVKVVLYPTKTDFQGKRVDCIRVDYPSQPIPKPVELTDDDESIPF